MFCVALTGGIGSGKSTVARVFEVLGIPVYYTDARAKALMETDEGLIGKLTALLGPETYRAGRLDRGYVASRIFNDKTLIDRVDSIVHPAVGVDLGRWAAAKAADNVPYVVFESAILFESGFDKYADYIVNVSAPVEERVERAAARSGIPVDAIRSRMANQMDDRERASRSDCTLCNADRDMVVPGILELDKFFRSESRK